MLRNLQIHHQEIANALQDNVLPMHRLDGMRTILFKSLIAMLYGIGLLFQTIKTEYGEGHPRYTWSLTCCLT